jgi:O-methyltransferase
MRRFGFLRLIYRHATMIVTRDFLANLEVVGDTKVKGAIVECGTWKGGMAAAMMEVAGPNRDYYFFDSFEGMPSAKSIDGEKALEWQRGERGPTYDNCAATLEDFRATIAHTHVPTERVHVYKGLFEDTLPTVDMPPIAILRLDGDWYESTMTCLEHLFDKVVPGGVIPSLAAALK